MGGMELKIKGYRKAGKMGNSVGVGIPKEVVDAMHIKPGDEFEIEADMETQSITIRKVQRLAMGGLSPEMEEELDRIFDRYDDTFKNLKDR